MHLKRWLTAIVALPVLIYLIGFVEYRWVLYSVLCLVALAGLNEFYRLTAPDMPLFIKIGSSVLNIILFASLLHNQILITMSIFPLFILLPMIYYLFANPVKGESLSSDIAKAVLGPFYVCLPLALLIPIDLIPIPIDRFYNSSQYIRGIWIFFLLIIIFANDTGAFYGGKLFGKYKLYESVSPKKTWEGAICGVILALFISILFLKLFRFHPVNPAIIAVTLILSVAGQVGDLAESMLKRSHNIKDSGTLLPGHGGVLDRIDSLLFAIPVLYIYLQLTI